MITSLCYQTIPDAKLDVGVAVAARADLGSDPVAVFCLALKQLRQASGYEPRTLARQLNISRAQLYAILNGEIKRPPDWAGFVGPLVEACTGGDTRAVSAWRQRHAVLVQVCEELNRQRRLQPLAADPSKTVPRERVAVRHTPADAAQGPAAARGPDWTAPRQLPAHTAHFVCRADELAALDGLLVHAAGMNPGIRRTAGTVVISAISGTAGVGKTALAVHWAHQVADRFPDGQLYVNLRGFDPSGPPMTPAEAIRGFLDAFEVPAERIPVSLDAQAALYRSLLAGRRVLVVLDNARDASQVRPLLPGSPGSSVVVTSRNRLTSLIAAGAHPLTVGLFTPADARQMLARRLGEDPVAAQPQAVQQIIARCARLPLALSIVAARAAAYPDFPLTALAEELRDEEGRLQALDAGEAATSVTAVFSWSYRQLSDPAARLFRLLGLHPGPDWASPRTVETSPMKGRGDGRDAAEVRSGLPGGCGPAGPGDR